MGPNAYSSVLLLDGDSLRHGASPRLPFSYTQAIDGVVIGNNVGSCGTAAFKRKRVVVSDIENDPLWQDYKEIALTHNLRACWSTPIYSSENKVLGTFAIYHQSVISPSKNDLSIIDNYTHLSGVAIEKYRSGRRQQALIDALNNANERFHAFLSVIPDLALVIDEFGTYVDIFGSSTDTLFANEDRVIGRNISDVFDGSEVDRIMGVIKATIQTNKVQICEYSLNVKKGPRTFEGRSAVVKRYLPEDPERSHVVWMARDITNRKKNEEEIERLAFYDALTELPNRRLLLQHLQTILDQPRKVNHVSALLYCDLDNFKRINDSLGHSIGDQLLRLVAQRLKPILQPEEIIARMGGDEFVIILSPVRGDAEIMSKEARVVAEKLIATMSRSFRLNEGDYKISISIGIAIIEGNENSAGDILRRADAAMYQSKSAGKNQFAFYNPILQSIIDQRLVLEREINEAVETNQFCVHYQPQINPCNGMILGAEALIRWNHPLKGLIPPDHFIPVAEQSGLIFKLQNIVLLDACRLIKHFDNLPQYHGKMSVAINISASQFGGELEKSLSEVVDSQLVDAKRLKLEITESMLMEDVEQIVLQMQRLKRKGFRFSIDDFGTGYSSLSYLHHFPIDELKIDKSFIAQIDTEGTAIVDTIIALSKTLGFNIIAEGVENPVQLNHLKEKDVAGVQGYLIAKPMPEFECINWVLENS